MKQQEAIFECVPNFSEGRDEAKVEQLVDCFRNQLGVKLVNFSRDVDHNRMVITAMGPFASLKAAVVQAVGTAVSCIDLNSHQGEHPRLGAADVIPFIPIRHASLQDADHLAKAVAQELAEKYQLPVYLYEQSATAPHRKALEKVRQGEFEGLKEKMMSEEWIPDFGPRCPHPTAGASIVGARNFLIAWNVNLKTGNLDIAKAIAKKIRFSSGGFPCVKALGMQMGSEGFAQVSMNLTDFNTTGMFEVFSAIQKAAAEMGVEVRNSELIGLLPLDAVVQSFGKSLMFEGLGTERIIESHLMDL